MKFTGFIHFYINDVFVTYVPNSKRLNISDFEVNKIMHIPCFGANKTWKILSIKKLDMILTKIRIEEV
jgi:hypothetical protein